MYAERKVATQAAPSVASSEAVSSSSKSLRTMTYDQQLQALSPVQLKTHGDGDDAHDEKIKKTDARDQVQALLDKDKAQPLTDAEVEQGLSLLDSLTKHKRKTLEPALRQRIHDESETRLKALLDKRVELLSQGEREESETLIGRLMSGADTWQAALDTVVAWTKADADVAALLHAHPDSPLSDAEITQAEEWIALLPAERQRESGYRADLDLRIKNDPIEAQLRADLAAGQPLDKARKAEIEATIATLTNGRQGVWTTRLNDRLTKDAEALLGGDAATMRDGLSTLSTDEVSKRASTKASRIGDKETNDELTRVRFGDAEIRVSTLKGLRKGNYADNVEALTKGQEEHLNLGQQALIAKAKSFLGNEQTPQGERAGYCEMVNLAACSSSPDLQLDAELITRMKRFTKFAAWAGLITGKPIVKDGVRSPGAAHRLSTSYMFTKGVGLGGSGNRKTVADWAIAKAGKDLDGTQWVAPTLVAELKKGGEDDEVRKDVLLTKVKANLPVNQQKKVAAEGYPYGDARRMPNVRSTGVSLHCSGQALDVHYAWVFSNAYDPMIDLLAAYFGLFRPVKDHSATPEHWHFEKIGSPIIPDATAE